MAKIGWTLRSTSLLDMLNKFYFSTLLSVIVGAVCRIGPKSASVYEQSGRTCSHFVFILSIGEKYHTTFVHHSSYLCKALQYTGVQYIKWSLRTKVLSSIDCPATDRNSVIIEDFFFIIPNYENSGLLLNWILGYFTFCILKGFFQTPSCNMF